MNEPSQINNELSLVDNVEEDEDGAQQTNNNKTLDKAIART